MAGEILPHFQNRYRHQPPRSECLDHALLKQHTHRTKSSLFRHHYHHQRRSGTLFNKFQEKSFQAQNELFLVSEGKRAHVLIVIAKRC